MDNEMTKRQIKILLEAMVQPSGLPTPIATVQRSDIVNRVSEMLDGMKGNLEFVYLLKTQVEPYDSYKCPEAVFSRVPTWEDAKKIMVERFPDYFTPDEKQSWDTLKDGESDVISWSYEKYAVLG